MELKENNKSIIYLIKNAYLNNRSKYIDVAYYYIRNLQQKGRINIDYIPSEDMIADGLIKPLQVVPFQRFITQLGLGIYKPSDRAYRSRGSIEIRPAC